MKYLLIIPIFLLTHLSEVTAQYNPVSLDMKNVAIDEILREIERQASIRFSYESSLTSGIGKKTIKVENAALSVCLDHLFAGSSIEYKISGNYVILKKKEKLITISGYIYDASSMETLIGAGVYDYNSQKGTLSNNYGFYSFSLPQGSEVNLRVSYVGYQSRESNIVLTKDTIINQLLIASIALKEVVIEGTRESLSNIRNTQLGMMSFSPDVVKNVPAILGEVDMLKVIQQTPGVVVGVEGFSGLHVRGGNKDENLFLVDGNPLYDVNHLAGFVSTFNPDAIKNTDFYKGSFPARYSGRLSSVIDVRIKDGDMQNYHGSFTIGLISAKAQLEGPIIKNKTSFNISARRTYLDLLAAPVLYYFNKDSKSQFGEDKTTAGYYFYDLNAKINHKFSDRSRIYLSVYNGRDAAKGGSKGIWDSYTYDQETIQPEEYQYTSYDEFLLKWKWGNFLTSFNWNYIFNNKLFGNASLIYTRYGSDIDQLNADKDYNKYTDSVLYDNYIGMKYKSSIQDWGYRMDFDYIPAPNHYIKFGSTYLYHIFCPEESGLRSRSFSTEINQQDTMSFINNRMYVHELAAYIEDDIDITSKLKVNVGLNYSIFKVKNKAYGGLQPRFSARYLFNDQFSAKVSYALMNQYVHLLSASYISLPSDLWVPVTDDIKPMQSQQVSAGLYYNLKKEWDFSIEGYYKYMDNLIEYKDGASLFSATDDWQKRVAIGNGRAYGVELMVQRKVGKTTGWLGYTLSWTDRQFPGGEINMGERYFAKYDSRHKINLVLNHKLSEKMDVNLSWTYYTGTRMTLPLEDYDASDPIFGQNGNNYNGSYSNSYEDMNPYIEKRYNYKLGDYHRLDLGFNFYRPKKNGRMGIWSVGIYNAYCRLNPFIVRPVAEMEYDYDENGSHPKGFRSGLEKITIFPFIPSISYTYKF